MLVEFLSSHLWRLYIRPNINAIHIWKPGYMQFICDHQLSILTAHT
uniref:Uncharacterized protein n=1 Tax=Arundo donax TaxID=35708 RepID=A0A0A9HNH9_ARUDO